jgi:hypothetical protein
MVFFALSAPAMTAWGRRLTGLSPVFAKENSEKQWPVAADYYEGIAAG